MTESRKKLPHAVPCWVPSGARFFITVCASPRGTNQLCNPEIWELMKESITHRQHRGDWWVHLLLVMPDHLHAIITFSDQRGMPHVMNHWKRYLRIHGGIEWQRDFFDHRLRRDESHVEKAHYIRMNPVRAGLAEAPGQWPYVWEEDLAH